MINWPHAHKTFVITLSAEEVAGRLAPVTVPRPAGMGGKIIFTGWVRTSRFRIMRYATRVNPFQPVVLGQLESTSRGCILVLQYQLLPVTQLLLIFGGCLATLLAVTTSFQLKEPLIALAIAGGAVLVAVIAWLNFRLHRQDLELHLLRVLQED
jgi:hypothetical protein